jgi:hypothetical protein
MARRDDRRSRKNRKLARRNERRSGNEYESTRRDSRPSENEWEPTEKGERRHVYSTRDPNFNMIAERAYSSVVSQGWINDKPCFITSNTGAFATQARCRLRIVRRTPNRRFMLQTASGETLRHWDGTLCASVCSSQKSRTSSSWDSISCTSMMHTWS